MVQEFIMNGRRVDNFFFRATVGRNLWEVVQRPQESWLWKTTLEHNNSAPQWAGQSTCHWYSRRGQPGWTGKFQAQMSEEDIGKRREDRLSGKKIKTLWEHDRGKYGWNQCERLKKSKRAWIVMTLWTYTSSSDSLHTEFLLHNLLCQPCTTQRWMELFQWENKIVLTRKKKGQFCIRKFSVLFKNVLIFCQANWADSSPAADLESSFSCVSWWQKVKSTKACQGGF